MKQLLFIWMMLIGLTLSAKPFYKSVLEYTDGTIKSGYAKVPNMNDKKISYKESEDGGVTSITSDDLFSITLITEKGTSYFLERVFSSKIYPKKSGEVKEKVGKKKLWLFLNKSHEKLNMYMGAQKYKINRKGVFQFISKAPQGHTITFPYYFKRPNEDKVTYITSTQSGLEIGFNKVFRNVASAYFKDKPKFSGRIKNKEFKKKDIYALYEAYVSE